MSIFLAKRKDRAACHTSMSYQPASSLLMMQHQPGIQVLKVEYIEKHPSIQELLSLFRFLLPPLQLCSQFVRRRPSCDLGLIRHLGIFFLIIVFGDSLQRTRHHDDSQLLVFPAKLVHAVEVSFEHYARSCCMFPRELVKMMPAYIVSDNLELGTPGERVQSQKARKYWYGLEKLVVVGLSLPK